MRSADAEVREWIRAGRPVPPPDRVKEDVLRVHAERYGLRVLVETGTYLGDMVECVKGLFERIVTIEISPRLSASARKRFKGSRHVQVLEGDSSRELRRLMLEIDEACLFWLDGHYSGGITARGEKDTPILEELDQILSAPDLGHVVVIDDARCFGTDPSYPTIEELRRFVRERRPNVEIVVENDSIRILPPVGMAPKRTVS
jgi:hypothetical protein